MLANRLVINFKSDAANGVDDERLAKEPHGAKGHQRKRGKTRRNDGASAVETPEGKSISKLPRPIVGPKGA